MVVEGNGDIDGDGDGRGDGDGDGRDGGDGGVLVMGMDELRRKELKEEDEADNGDEDADVIRQERTYATASLRTERCVGLLVDDDAAAAG
eukprot:1234887-Rhodomonas_salina.5